MQVPFFAVTIIYSCYFQVMLTSCDFDAILNRKDAMIYETLLCRRRPDCYYR